MTNNPIRILYVNGGLMDRGGVSAVMMSYYVRFDPKLIHIDFVVHGDSIGERDNEIIGHGSEIYRVPPKSKDPLGNYRGLRKIMSSGNYDIVHAHADSGNAVILKIAKKCGIKVRISHSHNTDFTINNKIRILLNNLQKKQIDRYATHKWACSKVAGEWLYGVNSDFTIIPNAIDVQKFKFNRDWRSKLRAEYGLVDKKVIGHIGRFDDQKNQKFLIEAFALAAKQDENLRLILIGDGKDRKKIENQIAELNISEKVILLGKRNDVNCLLNIFDVFVLPSKFEGLPVVTVEAQANGLQCICSDVVTKETNLTGNIRFLPLDFENWCEAILTNFNRDDNSVNKIILGGYEIESASKKLEEMYFSMVR